MAKKMSNQEIMNTSLRVQYWLNRIKHSQAVLQPCNSVKEAVQRLDRGKKPEDRLPSLAEMCLRHAVEVCPIDCNLTCSLRG